MSLHPGDGMEGKIMDIVNAVTKEITPEAAVASPSLQAWKNTSVSGNELHNQHHEKHLDSQPDDKIVGTKLMEEHHSASSLGAHSDLAQNTLAGPGMVERKHLQGPRSESSLGSHADLAQNTHTGPEKEGSHADLTQAKVEQTQQIEIVTDFGKLRHISDLGGQEIAEAARPLASEAKLIVDAHYQTRSDSVLTDELLSHTASTDGEKATNANMLFASTTVEAAQEKQQVVTHASKALEDLCARSIHAAARYGDVPNIRKLASDTTIDLKVSILLSWYAIPGSPLRLSSECAVPL